MVKYIKITKKTTTIIKSNNKNIDNNILQEHLHIYKILQHFGFKHFQKTAVTNLEKKLLTKYKNNEEHILQALMLQKKVLNKEFQGQTPPLNLCYGIDKDEYNFHIIGTDKSIYDALLIESAYSVIEELTGNRKNIILEISFVGDKESISSFYKELALFFKKNSKNIPKNILNVYKKNVLDAYRLLENVKIMNKEDIINIPSPIDYLSDESRNSFKEILEYIENLNMNFIINPFLIDEAGIYNGLIFKIKNIDNKKSDIYAIGGRHDIMAKKILGKKEIGTLSASIKGLSKLARLHKNVKLIDDKDIKFFYAQLGPEARFKTLKIMDIMRSASIPMFHALSKEKIGQQLAHAEKLGVPYLILVGHKEALQDAVMIRNMKNLSQENVPISELIDYIKKLL